MGKILVTGATGSVGKHVVSSLAGMGLEVHAVVRDPAKASIPKSVEVARGDLTSPETLEAALDDVDSVYLMWPGIPVEPCVVKAIRPTRQAHRVPVDRRRRPRRGSAGIRQKRAA